MATMQEQLTDFPTRLASDTFELANIPPKTLKVLSIPKRLTQFATSIEANHRAAKQARARAHFAAKMGYVLEEVDEPGLCVELLAAAGLFALLLIAPIMRQAHRFSHACRLGQNRKDR